MERTNSDLDAGSGSDGLQPKDPGDPEFHDREHRRPPPTSSIEAWTNRTVVDRRGRRDHRIAPHRRKVTRRPSIDSFHTRPRFRRRRRLATAAAGR
ncbi:MAG: hypothetical protein CBD91_08590 [Phycisphaeraceae bacterium TMED231]|nr:MAG: hypothetical protein CBD91_08590 [Phycisphaeraceae bacterium TMED231]